jgi:hypothetical protein
MADPLLSVFATIPQSKLAFVVSLNLHRRHLTPSQRAFVAKDMLPFYEEEARERQVATLKQGTESPVTEKIQEREKGEAAEKAAAAAHVNPRYVYDAKKLSEKAPKLAEAVKNGELAIPEAGPLQECGTRPAPGAPQPRE